MRKIKEIAKEIGTPLLVFALPLMAAAQFQGPGVTEPTSPVTSVTQLTGSGGLFCTIINWIFYLLIILTIIFVLVAAFKYLTAAGDPEKVKSAGATLLYAVVAIVIALVAKGIPMIVASFFNTGAITAC